MSVSHLFTPVNITSNNNKKATVEEQTAALAQADRRIHRFKQDRHSLKQTVAALQAKSDSRGKMLEEMGIDVGT